MLSVCCCCWCIVVGSVGVVVVVVVVAAVVVVVATRESRLYRQIIHVKLFLHTSDLLNMFSTSANNKSDLIQKYSICAVHTRAADKR